LNADVLNPRRTPRVPARCAVEVRHRLHAWRAETEDLGPSGCELVTPRLVSPGRTVKLEIELPALGRRVRIAGTVVWVRAEAPMRLGIAFHASARDAGWFEALLAADPALFGTRRRTIERLPRRGRVYLGKPPALVVDFTADEVAVLQRIGGGVTADALVRSFGETPERAVGALFALLGRGMLVLDSARSAGPARWRPALALAEAALAAASSAAAPQRPRAAQRLYDEGIGHIAGGRMAIAVSRLQEALSIAPDDEAIARALQRIERWA